jgi:hypothetical protein
MCQKQSKIENYLFLKSNTEALLPKGNILIDTIHDMRIRRIENILVKFRYTRVYTLVLKDPSYCLHPI